MIDADVMQDRIRDANPIPTLDALDADELAYFVATTRARRAAVMQAPTQHPTPTSPTAPPAPRRHRVWAFAAAFVLILVVVGAAALFLGGDDTPVTDEPVTVPPTVESAVTTTTVASIDQVPVEGGVVPASEWRVVVESEPWVKHIVDVEPLPGGGYVAVASEYSPWSVIWSPDGIAWRDGDPYEQVPAQTKRVVALGDTETIGRDPIFNHLVAVTGGGVVILDQLNTGVLVGDPQTGEWSPVSLDTRGLDGVPVPLAIVENDSRVLVVHAVENGSVAELVFWLVDPTTKASLGPFTSGIEMRGRLPQVGWVGDRWIVMTSYREMELDGVRNFLWVSPDAETWTEVALPAGDSTWEDDTYGLAFGGGSLTTAPSGALVQRWWMGGGDTWYSPDGVEWQRVREGRSNGPVYSDTYGFVMSRDDSTLFASDDGVTWHRLGGDRIEAGALLAASGRTVLQQLEVLATINDPTLGRASNLALWSEDLFPSTPTTTVPSVRAVTTPTLPPISGPRIEMTEDEYSAFMITFFVEWADAWISGDAARISSMFSDDAVYSTFGDGVEHHGRAEIEAALAAHFKRASYLVLDLGGCDHFPPLLDTPDGPVLDVTCHWTWGGTLDGDLLGAVPAATRFQINYANGTVLGCIQRIEWRGGGYQEIGPATGS